MATKTEQAKERPGYSDAERAKALELYQRYGPSEAARLLAPAGPSKGTLTKWAQAAGVECYRNEHTAAATQARSMDWRARRAALANEFGEVAAKALAKSAEALEQDRASDARGFMITGAVGVDKADQLSGVTLEGAQSLGRVDARSIMSAVAELLDAARGRAAVGVDVASRELPAP